MVRRKKKAETAAWEKLIEGAVRVYPTPFYLFWLEPFRLKVEYLQAITFRAVKRARLRHWYSYKTLPVPHIAKFALQQGLGIEVVSEFELAAAVALGADANDILVNGTAKHIWLPKDMRGITVVLDSLVETRELAKVASENQWRIGIRLAVSNQVDPDDRAYPAQFGMGSEVIPDALSILRKHNVQIEIVHFHLQSNVPSADEYIYALSESRDIIQNHNIDLKVIDVGGGLPDPDVLHKDNLDYNLESVIENYPRVISHCESIFPNISEIWLENGRFSLGPCGVLVIRVCDIKQIQGMKFLICDGGRTNHALQSDWEDHYVKLLEKESPGEACATTICGPTCMAYDWLYRGSFPTSASIGDYIVYYNAGAYHIPWEARFSKGHCRVLLASEAHRGESPTISEIRKPETFSDWQSAWE